MTQPELDRLNRIEERIAALEEAIKPKPKEHVTEEPKEYKPRKHKEK